jgi:hypothetical protein
LSHRILVHQQLLARPYLYLSECQHQYRCRLPHTSAQERVKTFACLQPVMMAVPVKEPVVAVIVPQPEMLLA